MKNIASALLYFLLGCGLAFRLAAQSTNEPLHPILTIAGYGTGAPAVTNIPESDYTNDFIPHGPPRAETYSAPAVVAGDTDWFWTNTAPNQLTSLPSGIVFPNTNAAYPVQTQAVTVFLTTATNNLTRTINVPYYNAAGSTNQKSLIYADIDNYKLIQLRTDFKRLDLAYVNSGSTPATRDDNYARRIAIALLDWARWHPSYYMSSQNSATFVNATTNFIMTTGGFGLQRASDHNGLAWEWEDYDIQAFDAIYSSVVLTNMNAEFGFNVRDYIANNLYFDTGDYFVNHVPIDVAIQSNLSQPYVVLADVARVLNRPDYIMYLDAYLAATVGQNIRRDGCLEQGMGYSIGYLTANQAAAQNTHDYFLTRAATNSLLLAVSNRSTIYANTFTYGINQWASVALPSGQLPSFGDTPFGTYFTARNAGVSGLLPAYGHVVMGTGATSNTAVQVNQNFPGNNNHMRSDTTAFALWAFNNPYLENIRYFNATPGRMFGEQILSHNALTIDRVNESPYPDADTYGNGDLTLYEPGNNGLALTEIDGQRDYADKASRYQRMVLLNTVDLAKPYMVDVMRVTGGTNHDYTLHGAIRWDQTWECSFPLVTNNNTYPMLEGETWVEPATAYSNFPFYGFWRNVSSNAAPSGNFQITYRDTNRVTARDLRLWMTDNGTANVYLGITPIAARSDTDPANFYGFWRPSAIIRHRIPSGTLSDLFVSVIEPFNTGVSNIVSVTRLPMSGTTNESVGLKITFKDGRTDTYLVNLRNPQIAGATGGAASVATADGQYALAGRVGLQVDQTNGAPRVWTMNASDFQYPGRRLTTPTNIYYSGLIAGSTRKYDGATYDAFTTTTPLPVGTALRNEFLSFTHGALTNGTTGVSELFVIDQVVFTNGLYHVCFTNDHYLEITNGTNSVEQVAPLRKFTTSNAFEIAMSASAQPLSPIADRSIGVNGSSGPISFTFGDLGATPGSALSVQATAANQTLLPNTNLIIGGSGTNRTLTVTPAAGLSGTTAITVAVTDGVWTNSETFNVLVSSAFTLGVAPASSTVVVGNSTNFTVTLTTNSGFTGSVIFGVSGLPANAGASFNPASRTNSGSSTLTVTTATNTPAGSYPLTISGTNGLEVLGTISTLVIGKASATVTLGNLNQIYDGTAKNPTATTIPGGLQVDFTYLGLPGAPTNVGSYTVVGTINNASYQGSATNTLIIGNPAALTWRGFVNGVWDTTTANWLGANYADGDVVTFDDTALNYTVTGGNVAPGAMTFNHVNSYTVSANMGGAGSLTKTLSGTLTLTGTNTFTGDVTLGGSGGTVLNPLTLAGNGRLGSSTSKLLTGAAPRYLITIQDSAVATFTNILLNCQNPGSQANLFNQAGGTVNCLGTGIGAAAAMQLGTAGTSLVTYNFSGGTLNVTNGDLGLCLANANLSALVQSGGTANLKGVYFQNNGGLTLSAGTLNLGIDGMARGANLSTINLLGGTVGAFGGDWSSSLAMNLTNTTTVNTLDSFDGATARSITLAGVLSGSGGLTKTGAGTLTLTNANTFSGNTTVSNGTLALSGSASISNSSNLIVNAGATLDVSGRTDGKLTLVSGQNISGNGTVNGQLLVNPGAIVAPGASLGVLTVSSNVTLLGATVMELSPAAATNDVLQTSRALTYGGTLSLTNLAGALTNGGGFKLFSAASYAGAFASVIPVIPAINLAWNTNALTNGTLRIVASPTPPPVLGAVALSGTNVILRGTNGVPNWPCVLLFSTNLARPWTPVATNPFDGNGNLSFTNVPSRGVSQSFYRLQLN